MSVYDYVLFGHKPGLRLPLCSPSCLTALHCHRPPASPAILLHVPCSAATHVKRCMSGGLASVSPANKYASQESLVSMCEGKFTYPAAA